MGSPVDGLVLDDLASKEGCWVQTNPQLSDDVGSLVGSGGKAALNLPSLASARDRYNPAVADVHANRRTHKAQIRRTGIDHLHAGGNFLNRSDECLDVRPGGSHSGITSQSGDLHPFPAAKRHV